MVINTKENRLNVSEPIQIVLVVEIGDKETEKRVMERKETERVRWRD